MTLKSGHIYLYSTLYNAEKQLQMNKQNNDSVNVVKFIHYETNSISPVKQLYRIRWVPFFNSFYLNAVLI